MTCVDDAEPVALGVGQHHEVGIDGIVPEHASRSEPEKPFDLRRLFGRVVDHEIEMHSRPLLDRRDRPVHSDPRPTAIGRDQDREVVIRSRKRDSLVAEHVGPEGDRPFDIICAQDDGSKL